MIGKVEAECPYCNHRLDKKPGRKKKCPNCGEFIYVRTSPKTGEKILITELEKEIIEEQWSIVNGTHEQFKRNKRVIETEKEFLKKKFGREPSDNDVRWSLLNKELMRHASDGNWGLYRNSKFSMAEILSAESKEKQALSTYLEVSYLDLNGPCNTGGFISNEFPPFRKSLAFVAPGVVGRASKIIAEMKLGHNETKTIFDEIAEVNFNNLKLPVKPETAWKKIKKELFQ